MPSTATSILDGLSTSVAVKAPCRTVATSNITLAGLQTISGYTTDENDRVLVKGQTNPVENGIYMASTGNWTRSKDADGNRDLVQGSRVLVRSTAIDGVEYELTTPNPIVIGTTALTFELRYGANATYDQTEAEIAAGVTPALHSNKEGYLQRYGGDATGVSASTTALANAAAQNSQTGGVSVKIAGGTYRIDASTTIASGVTLDFTEGGMLSIDSGDTLTINGRVIAAPGQQIFTGSGTVVFGSGAATTAVYPNWWGTSTNTIRSAVAAVAGRYIPVLLVDGHTYTFDTKISLTNHGDAIIGTGRHNDTNNEIYSGTVLQFTGSGVTAIEIGVSPDTNGNFCDTVNVGGFLLRVPENCTRALRCWHLGGRSQVHDITIRGNSDNDGTDNFGVLIEGCIDTEFNRILVFGDGALGADATLLENGFRIQNGFGGSVSTTLTFYKCHANQCRVGYWFADDSLGMVMINCIAQSCHDAGLVLQNSFVNLVSPYFEDNGRASTSMPSIKITGAASVLSQFGGVVNIGSNQYFYQCQADNKVMLSGGILFQSSHASPRTLSLGGTQPKVSIVGDHRFATSQTDSDTAITNLIKIHDGTVVANGLRVAQQTPASAAAAGTANTLAFDASYIYICTSTNTWKRVAIATW